MKKSSAQSKFRLYEEFVQSPKWQVEYLPQFHTWLSGKEPLRFREDFCGSARVACEWVMLSKKHTALGVDLDPRVLEYARSVNRSALTPDQQSRISLLRSDVRKPTRARFDWIGAFNFSIFEFHERDELLKYLRAARESLVPKGSLFLEVAGGAGFQIPSHEKRSKLIQGFGRVTQIWEQHHYDPIQQTNDYAIHFKLADGKWLNGAFTYHWRIWGLRELRDALKEAGYSRSVVLWEKSGSKGEPLHEFLPSEEAPNHDFYIAYIVATK